jgi:soluble lytic murein transglycosylase-like protein
VNRGWGASGILLLAALLGAAPAHAADWIYVQQQDGVRSYSDRKPAQGEYTRLAGSGRPTASASCGGLTATSLQKRAALYAAMIRKHAIAHRLSPELVSAVMRVESCYDRRAVSRSGARGLMQLMPATAAELGVHDSFDPEQNIAGGVRYLARMLARFDHDLRLGLAAYNAGPEAVAAHGGVPPYPNTVSYVSRILKLYRQKT